MPVLRGMTDEAKLAQLNETIAHLELVKKERLVYTESITNARKVVSDVVGGCMLGPHISCSLDAELHYII